ncbi:cytochrome P450 [Streptomyces sp. PTM05]|uniref:Cytochrome P450 n=1 Tax=Streptantibioticus parmotrematis TaxID=2873249 RepID=A0ABS7QUV5_9ACTN|nr:cytochrome P450 [Streptantibioticus parmotrematis]MBY8886990.1 cytochrome P450 [Streptantibioticus parmotrematis]
MLCQVYLLPTPHSDWTSLQTPLLPRAPHALPLLGHILPLLRDPLDFLLSLHAQGDLVRIRIGPVPAVVVCEPRLTWDVLRNDRVFDKGGAFFDRGREVAGNGLGTCPFSHHRRQRRLLQPAFHPRRLPSYATVMIDRINAVTDSWRDGQILDVVEEMTHITSATTVAAMFSDAPPQATLQQALDDLSTLLAGVYRRMLTPYPLDRLPTPANRRYYRARTSLRRICDEIISVRRLSGVDHGDVLSALIFGRDPQDETRGLDNEEIIDQVLSFFLAGTETTAYTLAWALHLLAQHSDILNRLHDEVDFVLGGRSVTADDLPRLELTRHVITETLRLCPTAWIFTRLMTSDAELGDYQLAAGTHLVYSPYLVHHHPELYDNPDRFDPDRWLTERARFLPRHAFIPFGGGARKCIGDTFSFAEATYALATIVSRWRLLPTSDQPVRPALAAIMRPTNLHMRLVARKSVPGL